MTTTPQSDPLSDQTETPDTAAPMTLVNKPVISAPPSLQADATYQTFQQRHLCFEYYAVLVGLHSLPATTQLIHLRSNIALDAQRLITYTLGIPLTPL